MKNTSLNTKGKTRGEKKAPRDCSEGNTNFHIFSCILAQNIGKVTLVQKISEQKFLKIGYFKKNKQNTF